MLKQIQKAVEDKTPTKLIIESFQKQDGMIFTSERTSLELDVEVYKKIILFLQSKYTFYQIHEVIKIIIMYIFRICFYKLS